MNTIKKRALTSIAVCFMACLMFSMPVLAASNSFSKTTVKLNAIDGGVSQIAKVSSGSVLGTNPKITQVKVYLNVASGYASYINTAMSEWVNTTSSMGVTTPISYTKTTTQSSSRMDIYQVSTVNEWWGLTTMYNGSTEVDPFSSNWAWGKIQLDADFSDLSENKRLAVIAHEMGHVMGLAHSDFSNVLMRADIAYNSSSTSRAQTNDLGGINYLYK